MGKTFPILFLFSACFCRYILNSCSFLGYYLSILLFYWLEILMWDRDFFKTHYSVYLYCDTVNYASHVLSSRNSSLRFYAHVYLLTVYVQQVGFKIPQKTSFWAFFAFKSLTYQKCFHYEFCGKNFETNQDLKCSSSFVLSKIVRPHSECIKTSIDL